MQLCACAAGCALAQYAPGRGEHKRSIYGYAQSAACACMCVKQAHTFHA